MPESGHDNVKHSPGLPGAEGSEFYAPPRAERRNQSRRESDRRGEDGRRATDYGLSHRSERDYPEAYVPVSTEFWQGLSQSQVDAVMRLQATAMEKAGYEKGAPKFFIEDFDPGNPNAPRVSGAARGSTVAVDRVAQAAPRLILGGILLGMGSLALALGLTGILQPIAPIAGVSAAALITGLILAITGR